MVTDLLLNGYTWSDSSNNKWSIWNSSFAYVKFSSNTFSGPPWRKLNINNAVIGNANLVDVTNNLLKVTVNGIYKLRVTLIFTGGPDGTEESINFSLSTSDINGNSWSNTNDNMITTNLDSNETISSSTPSKILSFGNLYSTSTDLVLFSANRVQFQIFSKVPFTNNGISVIENILFLKNDTTLYFNVSGEGTSPVALNASGNFMLELLSAVN